MLCSLLCINFHKERVSGHFGGQYDGAGMMAGESGCNCCLNGSEPIDCLCDHILGRWCTDLLSYALVGDVGTLKAKLKCVLRKC